MTELVPQDARLVVAYDWIGDVEVPPQCEYEITCMARQPVEIQEVIVVRGFPLVQISIGSQTIEVAFVSSSDEEDRYRFESPLALAVGMRLVARLRNDADVFRRPKVGRIIFCDKTLEEHR